MVSSKPDLQVLNTSGRCEKFSFLVRTLCLISRKVRLHLKTVFYYGLQKRCTEYLFERTCRGKYLSSVINYVRMIKCNLNAAIL